MLEIIPQNQVKSILIAACLILTNLHNSFDWYYTSPSLHCKCHENDNKYSKWCTLSMIYVQMQHFAIKILWKITCFWNKNILPQSTTYKETISYIYLWWVLSKLMFLVYSSLFKAKQRSFANLTIPSFNKYSLIQQI